ncbi:hypothetical protein LX16_1309 [Stackebrandtia albiflava]|uniref:TROVE domain-containing protein n=1 Tax=Stackebrandtia albiflava TaxID=406432 RepID=A0A562VCM4_9ACTN|nr:hypothetical protein [Stackebrandtia albiflava]TWJ15598.1 hypothetical protein LX16_1309 [Stackebrandtia albiflava]
MTDTLGDLVACDDILMFANAAVTATGARDFHDDAATRALSLDFLHEYMRVNYRRLYAASLALDVNDHNAGLMIAGLLATRPDGEAHPDETALIMAALRRMTPPRVYRLFRRLRGSRVNNRRTRAVIRDWLAGRPLALDAVKYRTGLKVAVRHAHLSLPEELARFLFGDHRRPFTDPLLNDWWRAHYDQRAIYRLPFTVAEGFAARHGIPRDRFLAGIEDRLTGLERLRLRDTRTRHGLSNADLSQAPLQRICAYVLSLTTAQRRDRRAELSSALRTAAARIVAGRRLPGTVVAVLDDSYSSLGSPQRRNRPLAVALAAHHILAAWAEDYRGLWLSRSRDPLLVTPRGASGIGGRVIDALELRPDHLIIVSDGWDNSPPGLAKAVLGAWRRRIDVARQTAVVHLNPGYDPRRYDVRRLADGVPTIGIRDAADIPALVELAGFAEGRRGMAELHAHLDLRVARLLGRGHDDRSAALPPPRTTRPDGRARPDLGHRPHGPAAAGETRSPDPAVPSRTRRTLGRGLLRR